VGTVLFNPIVRTSWLENHALTLKKDTKKYCFGANPVFLQTFQKFSSESRKIQVKRKIILLLLL
jgi:hypothetical protein